MMLDTFHDRRRAYAFQTTPLGVQWDAIWSEASRDEVEREFRHFVRHSVDVARQSDCPRLRGVDGDSFQEPALSVR